MDEQATDWNEELFEEEEHQEEAPISGGERVIFAEPSDPTIGGLYSDMIDGLLEVSPDFQRGYVWDNARASRLIESVLLSFPLPTIFLAEEDDGSRVVIDGQQRLTTFRRFMQGDLTLRGLKSRTDLNGLRYSELPRHEQTKFKGFPIRTITILRQSKSSVRFEMFHRINSGSVALNDQELRNCVFRGTYNVLLKELARDGDFQSWFRPGSLKRMRDVELVLRFAAFYHKHFTHYTNMRSFLNEEMEAHQQIQDSDVRELRTAFRKSVRLSKAMLGEHGFRRLKPGTKNNPNGEWSNSPSATLYDVVMYGFTLYHQNQVYPLLDSIHELLLWMMTSDEDFIRAIDNTTGSPPNVQMRFNKWLDALQEVVGAPEHEPRFFSRSFKEQLFTACPDCAICGSRINFIDDASVDHIDQYWRGGKTIPENARLAHRYCNVARARLDKCVAPRAHLLSACPCRPPFRVRPS